MGRTSGGKVRGNGGRHEHDGRGHHERWRIERLDCIELALTNLVRYAPAARPDATPIAVSVIAERIVVMIRSPGCAPSATRTPSSRRRCVTE